MHSLRLHCGHGWVARAYQGMERGSWPNSIAMTLRQQLVHGCAAGGRGCVPDSLLGRDCLRISDVADGALPKK